MSALVYTKIMLVLRVVLFSLLIAEFIDINFISYTAAYKPVFIIHGILTGNKTMLRLAQRIKKAHPGTEVYVSDRFCNWASLQSMVNQVEEIGADILKFSVIHPEGFHLLGYSQGGLVARGLLEYYSDHKVHTFISLSSPQAGQYGDKFLHMIFKSLIRNTVYKLFYTRSGQYISIGNYWKDPYHQELYYNQSSFLPYINNEMKANYSEKFKHGITKLHKMVLIGGPDDGVISPWQSSHFGYYNENESVINMENWSIYQDDLFGLRTLDKNKKLHLITVPGVEHHFWHRNLTVINQHILPWLN